MFPTSKHTSLIFFIGKTGPVGIRTRGPRHAEAVLYRAELLALLRKKVFLESLKTLRLEKELLFEVYTETFLKKCEDSFFFRMGSLLQGFLRVGTYATKIGDYITSVARGIFRSGVNGVQQENEIPGRNNSLVIERTPVREGDIPLSVRWTQYFQRLDGLKARAGENGGVKKIERMVSTALRVYTACNEGHDMFGEELKNWHNVCVRVPLLRGVNADAMKSDGIEDKLEGIRVQGEKLPTNRERYCLYTRLMALRSSLMLRIMNESMYTYIKGASVEEIANELIKEDADLRDEFACLSKEQLFVQ